ncbi:hypothetical protein BDY21DRAFT_266272, partial [Lineolata rhizophorae]
RFIDCENRTIVSENVVDRYAAPSYVWGAHDSHHSDRTPFNYGNLLPSNLPTVIEDSTFAAGKLGYIYLWVDRYCVNQDNLEDKHHQISTWRR